MSRKRPAEVFYINGDKLIIQPLGAGQEVGRSCVYLKFRGKKILLDCGIHPGKDGHESLPYFDMIQNELDEIDLLLISHFHLDHIGGLPWFLMKTLFKGKCFMTHATKAIYRWLLSDYVRVSNQSADKMLYTEKDIEASMEKIGTISFHQEKEVNGIKFWCYNAGHVLGAAMFMIEIEGVKILYTGDFSREEDRHLMSAELPKVKPDVLIIESTYGTRIHEPRDERESRFTNQIQQIITRGGRCLIPVFALGRAQELLLILDEYWAAHEELHHIPIYYASSLAKKCMTVYQTYVHAMNETIQKQIVVSNPFKFKHISYLRSPDHFEDTGPCVVLASPGMMQSGFSRELFESWCTEKKNGVIIAGYSVSGTLANDILSQPKEIKTMSGKTLPLNCSVDSISFSAHTDYQQTSEFVKCLKPAHIVLVHGEQNEMNKLKSALTREYADATGGVLDIHDPKNGQCVELTFKGEKPAKIVGQLAEKRMKHGDIVSGILVKQNFTHKLISPSDLSSHTNLTRGLITPKISVPFTGTFNQLLRHLYVVCQDVEVIPSSSEQKIKVCNAVTVTVTTGTVLLEWTHNRFNNMLVDTMSVAILTMPENISEDPVDIPPYNPESHFQEELMTVLNDMFGKDCIDPTSRRDQVHLVVNDNHITINTDTMEVTCDDAQLQKSLTNVIKVLKDRDLTRTA